MPKLSPDTKAATSQLIVGNDGATDASSQSQHRHVLGASASAKLIFRPAGRVRVIFDKYRVANPLLQSLPEWFSAPVEVWSVKDMRLIGIYDSSGSDPYPRYHVCRL
jgi:hypothetical protein